MESINVVRFCFFVIFSCLCFYFGLARGENKFRARLQWIKASGLKKEVIYEVLTKGNIYSNVYAVVLRDGKNQDFGLLMAEFELPKTRFVKVSDDWKLIPASHNDKPADGSQTPVLLVEP